tara:strand:- start:3080 stop:4738 length:1659 start_codon:yes stop_codon:yes gene_type:complete
MSTNLDDEFSFRDCIKFLFRNKKIFLIFSIFGLLISFFNIKTSKEVWEGEIKILLQGEKSNNMDNSALKLIAKNVNNVNSLSTQLEILKSPSVLLPVYDFMNSKKSSSNENFKPPSFNSWVKGSLDIFLVENTSVLNVKLYDTEKNLIVPILEKITEEYKNYPIKTKVNRNEIYKNSLKRKIKEAERNSINSEIESDNFSKSHKIYLTNGEIKSGKEEASIRKPMVNLMQTIDLTTNYESEKFAAEQRIISLNNKLNLINELKDDFEIDSLIYIFPRIKNDPIAIEISSKYKALQEKNIYFKPNDKEIKKLKKIIYILKTNLKQKTYSLISEIIKENKFILSNSDIPKDIINTYKKLALKAYRDKYTLNQLENFYLTNNFNFQEASWKAISKPTLLMDPINNHLKIFIKTFFVTILVGLFIAISLEIYGNKIYDDSSLRKILNKNIFTRIKKDSEKSWEKEINFLKKVIKDYDKYLYLYPENNSEIYDLIINKFNKYEKKELIFSKDLLDIYEYKKAIIFINEGFTTNYNLDEITKRIKNELKDNIEFILLN